MLGWRLRRQLRLRLSKCNVLLKINSGGQLLLVHGQVVEVGVLQSILGSDALAGLVRKHLLQVIKAVERERGRGVSEERAIVQQKSTGGG